MRPPNFTSFIAAALVAVSLAPREANAEPPVCPPDAEPGIESVLPADGASGVTTDAYVRVRYTEAYFVPGAPPDETITLTGPEGPVAGRVEVVGDRDLFFLPSSPLSPNSHYTGEATSTLPFAFGFNTGAVSDSRPPSLIPPDLDPEFDISSAVLRDGCEGASGSRRIGITFSSASDDGPPASLEYYLYLTRGPGVSSPILVADQRSYGATTTIAFVLPPQQLESVVCVSLVAVDGVGNATQWAEPDCFDPVTGTAFYGMCSASPLPNAPRAPILVVMACAILATKRLARARRSVRVD